MLLFFAIRIILNTGNSYNRQNIFIFLYINRRFFVYLSIRCQKFDILYKTCLFLVKRLGDFYMTEKMDRRVRKTKAQLREGLARLMQKKSIKEISVKDW